ncbi:hypothetical protein Tco_0927813, partial [Tanacetum coccineum]
AGPDIFDALGESIRKCPSVSDGD